MRKIFVLLTTAGLFGCAAVTAVQTGKPLDPEQVRQDLAILQAVGCVAAVAGEVAAPAIAATVDDDGQRIAVAVDQTSGRICSAPSLAITGK